MLHLRLMMLSAVVFGLHSCGTKKDDEEETTAETTESSSGSGYTVSDADGNELGTLTFNEWSSVGIEFEDGGIGVFGVHTGTFLSGLCEVSHCTIADHELEERLGAEEFLDMQQGVSEFGYCYFKEQNCNGECYVADEPVKDSIFQADNEDFIIARGTESRKTDIAYYSVYSTDLQKCVTSSGNLGTLDDGYKVTKDYSILDSLSYPFSAPLQFDPKVD